MIIKKILKKFICKYIRNIPYNPIPYKKSKKIFKYLNKGDIVHAIMPLSYKEISNVEIGHRSRPYLVAYKDDKYAYCFYCTSSIRVNNKNVNHYAILSDKEYSCLKSKTFVDLKHLHKIPIRNIEYNMFTLNKYTKKAIERKLMILSYRKYYNISLDVDIDFEVGDIIKKGMSYYYVYGLDRKHLFVHPATRNSKYGYEKFCHEKLNYFVDTKNKDMLKNDNSYILCDNLGKLVDLQIKASSEYKKANLNSNNKVSKKKKKKIFPRYKFAQGQILHDRFINKKYIYLYSYNHNDYAVDVNYKQTGPNLKKIMYADYLDRKNIITKDELNDIKVLLIENDCDPFGILRKVGK